MRSWLIWMVGFVSFPLAGIAGEAVGPLDSSPVALVGGLVTGLVIGAGQSLASRGRLDPRRWILLSGAGMSLGLAAGATLVGFGTSLGDLALMGAVTGVALGAAQAFTLPRQRAILWAVGMPALWALGWTVATVVGIDVDRQYTVFGSTGALTVSALSGLLLALIVPAKQPSLIGEPA